MQEGERRVPGAGVKGQWYRNLIGEQYFTVVVTVLSHEDGGQGLAPPPVSALSCLLSVLRILLCHSPFS